MPNSQTNSVDSPTAPAQNCFAIVPDNDSPLPFLTKALYVGTGGDIVVRLLQSAADVTFFNVPTGYILDVRAIAVRATGTTAENIVGLA